MNRTETTILSDADFNTLVAQAVAAGERLIYTVKTPARRSYLVGLLAGNNMAEIRLIDTSNIQGQLDEANAQLAEALAAKEQSDQRFSSIQDEFRNMQALHDENSSLKARVAVLTDQVTQTHQSLSDANAAIAQLQAENNSLNAQLSDSEHLANLVEQLRGNAPTQ